MRYKEYKSLNFPEFEKEILSFWQKNNVFKKSLDNRKGKKPFVFYEGPPSANGLPGIHHVIARTIKDIFCRYKTMKGYQVKRKGGWDTHGLPVELGVEKSLGITKEDIGKKISIEEYNKTCRTDVMKYKTKWEEMTEKMGYWVDLEYPYITFDNQYIESVWYLLKELYNKKLLYKGYSVQPYSPAAGTGLSSHELNLPGCYKDVTDTSMVAQFKVVRDSISEGLFDGESEAVYFLAWTTTPWTLPSNCALAIGEKIIYVKVRTFNQYTYQSVSVILAKELVGKYFSEKAKDLKLEDYKQGDKLIPFEMLDEYKGKDLVGMKYEQLMPYVQPAGEAFKVIPGDFVSTEEGTGIVHTASVFGADDFRVCQRNNIPSILVKDDNGNDMPLVDKNGKFVKEMDDFADRYVKPEYEKEASKDPNYKPTDVLIAIKLKKENKAFLVERYTHSYPHCWRTDKPILYYPLDSWFIKTTVLKDRMVELNKTINWQPPFTGTGRFGNWLENLVDWNLSRSRYWGTPLPVWITEDGEEIKCIGSFKELKEEVNKAVEAGFMKETLSNDFDLHRPYVDEIVLVSSGGKKMLREPDLIDVWFDSGAMPYAQWHYPFENKEVFETNFPADFISEGVDQTRGWFFTLHAIAVMLFDSVAYKNVLSHGLVLDKQGNKMSKSKGNVVDPFETIEKYGADATRWYMIVNSQPWDNIRFDIGGVQEVQRKFLGTLYNIYAFFVLYANIDGFEYKEDEIPVEKRSEIDKWIISLLNSLVKKVDKSYSEYEPTKAARFIQEFVIEYLSNWYVRLCRRRFWKGEYNEDKIAAYQTLYQCIEVVTRLMSCISPFFSDRIFINLNEITKQQKIDSVHLADFPITEEKDIDKSLEERMQIAQDISSMVLSIRKKVNIKVRQPLNKILVPVFNDKFKKQLEKVEQLILSETNVKRMEHITDTQGIVTKKVKPNFKMLGAKVGAKMKQLIAALDKFNQKEILAFEKKGSCELKIDNKKLQLNIEDVEITSEDMPGWLVENKEKLTVALDVNVTDDLKNEGIARELVNRIQKIRKESNFDVTDRIRVKIEKSTWLQLAVNNYFDYICNEILAEELIFINNIEQGTVTDVNELDVKLLINKA